MRRAVPLLLPLLFLATLSACSYITDFVVVNDSGSPVEVRYTFKRAYRYEQCCSYRPARKPLDRLEDGDTHWGELSDGEYTYDPAAGAVTLTLEPGEALRIFSTGSWRGHGDRDDDENFAVESVRIEGANGGLEYAGKQAQYQFQRKDGTLYKLTYYGWGDKRYDGGR